VPLAEGLLPPGPWWFYHFHQQHIIAIKKIDRMFLYSTPSHDLSAVQCIIKLLQPPCVANLVNQYRSYDSSHWLEDEKTRVHEKT